MTATEMTLDRLRAAALEELLNVAPDLAGETIALDADLRETLDLDSMDFVNWVAALHRRLGVDIPELDYPKLRTFDATAAYLSARLAAGHMSGAK
jgi:acyl carrier protein